MRILYLTNGFPFPLTSGYLRHYFLIKELAQRHTISLLSIVGASFSPEHGAALEPFTERVLTFTSAHKGRSMQHKALGRLRSLAGEDQADEAVQQMGAAIERLLREESFDAVLFSGKRTSPVVKHLKRIPIVVDMCDATSMKIRGSMRYARLSKLPVLLLDYVQVRRTERALAQQAAQLIFASCRDREALLGDVSKQAAVVPNGVDLDFWRRSPQDRGPNTIIFTGAMDYPPNTDAALYLIEEILPLVQQSVPDAQALIVGRDPTPRLIKAGRRSGVTVTGFVDDVRPYLEQATVFAAPLRFGAGIQNKLLEAMAMEVPVVASPLAADGLRTEEGKRPPVQVAGNKQQFAELIIQQLRDRARNPAPDLEARCFVEHHFVWKRSAEKLEQVFATAAGRRSN
jgi:polysaccharide biosynthesis protein PslH